MKVGILNRATFINHLMEEGALEPPPPLNV